MPIISPSRQAGLRTLACSAATGAAWQRRNFRPVWIGEFGSYERADRESRVRYTGFVREEIESRGFSWAYWELASRFGIYDPKARAWHLQLRDALKGSGAT